MNTDKNLLQIQGTCELCGKAYYTRNWKRNVLNHLKHCPQNINSEKYKCKSCDKEFEKRHSLIAHYSHCLASKISCNGCGESFSRISTHICGSDRSKGNRRNVKKVIPVCKWCDESFETGLKMAAHRKWCEKNPNSIIYREKSIKNATGRYPTEETKKKISNSRIKYLMEHPDQVPYLINHSSKISYPEMIFKNALESAKIEGWEYNYQNGIYQYDFAFINLKIDVEIDGGTHLTEKVKKIDERRDKFSIDNGWKVIRFTAKRVKEDVISCIEELNILLR